MIIHSPIFSGSINQAESAYANLSGSFTGSFKGVGQFEGLEADSVAYANVTGKPTLVSGSSQVSYPDLSNIPSGIISSSAQIDTLFNIDGLVSGGGEQYLIPLFKSNNELTSSYLYQNADTLKTFDFETGLKGITLSFVNDQYSLGNFINPTGSAITVASNNGITEIRNSNYTLILDKLLVGDLGSAGYTEALQVSGSIRATGTISATSFNGTINANNGVVSGSSQVNADSITNFDANVKDKLNIDTVVSGSSQILSLVSIDEDTMSSNSDTKVPTQQSVKTYVDNKVSALVDSAPATLDTLNELAAALGDDANFATTISTTIGGKVSQSLEIISGNGLTGGGNLTTNRTLAVGAGDGISVSADAVAVDGTVLRTTGFGVVSGSTQVQFNDITNNPFSHSGSNVTILAGKKIRSSDENTIVIAENLDVEGNITLLGAVDGVDIAAFKSDFDAFKQSTFVTGSSQVSFTTISNKPSLVSGSGQIDITSTTGTLDISSRTNLAVSDTSNVDMILTGDTLSANLKGGVVSGSAQVTSLLPSGVVSGSSQVTSLLPSGVVSGSSQVVLASTNGFSTFSSSVDSRILTEKGRVDAILLASDADKDSFAEIVALINSVDTTNDTAFASFVTSSNSSQAVQDGRLTSLEAKTASLDSDNTAQNARLSSLESATASLQGTDITITLTGDVTGTGTITNLGNVSFATTVAANSVELGTDTTGNYVGTITAGNGIVTSGATSGEGVAHTISVGGGVVSGSSQITYSGISSIPAGIVSGSSQVTPLLPSGVVSGSSQVNADTITNFDANVLAYNNSLAVVSGSASSVKTFLSLQNVTNESKATMFSSPTFTGTVSGVTATMVGLGNVTNESKATMFTNAALTGTPTAPTAPANTNSTQIATTAYVQTEISDLIGGANAAFDTLIEISASLASGDSTLNTLVDGKLSKASNLSDLTDTSAARTNLGLAIGTNVQAYNATLAAVAGGTYSGDDSITTIGTVTAGSVTAILPTGVVSGSSQINHNTTTNYVANQHIDHTAVTITAGDGLTGGGTIAASRTLNVVGTSNRIFVSADAVDIAATYVGQTSITTLGTITTGTWNGTAIANANLANSTISGISLGSNLNSLTAGTGVTLSGGYDGSTARTISIGQAVGTGDTVQFAKVGVGGASDATYELRVVGDIGATGDIVAYVSSDERLKNNVELISNPIEKVQALRGVTWEWNELASDAAKQSPNVGVIAQEVEKVLPQLVHDRENGFKGVDYAKLTGLLIEAIKEQQKQIDELKSRL